MPYMHSLYGILIFAAIFTSIYLGMHYYLAFWTIRHFSQYVNPGMVRIILLLAALSFPLIMFLLRRYPDSPAKHFAFAAYIWMGIAFLWFSLAVCSDLISMLLNFAYPAINIKPFSGPAILALACLISAYSVFKAFQPPIIRKLNIKIEDLPAQLEGFSLAYISDVHIGATFPLKRFAAICRQIEQLNPDILLITGDIFDSGFDRHTELNKQLLPKTKYGSVGTFGNHEFYFGLDKASVLYQKAGIKILRQSFITLPNGLQIAGIDDARTTGIKTPLLDNILSRLDPSKPSILLSHEPVFFETAAKRNINLMLSGHTHAGQVFPFNFFVRLEYPRIYGLYKLAGSYLYVTSGTGYWGPPMRFMTDSEIVYITLNRAV